jgi:hypothetical protein
MSVSDGYNALIRGVVSFTETVTDQKIRDALHNLFLKYAEVQLFAENIFGKYSGKIDYAASPEIRRFIRLSDTSTAWRK